MKIPSNCGELFDESGSELSSDMSAVTAAEKLEEAILSGDLVAVKLLLDNVVDYADVLALEKEFTDRDPVVCAIDNDKEQIAVYLTEKKFTITNLYCYPGEECEPYCYATHEGRQCPCQYTAMDLAKNRKQNFLLKVLSDIQSGRRKAGDSLSEESRICVDSTELLKRQSWLDEISQHQLDKHLRIAETLTKLIADGDYLGIRGLLNPIVLIHEVEAIIREYPDRDPLIAAVEAGQEKIACYLIEKRFPYNQLYNYPGMECDEWCCRLHTNQTCPNQYTALDVAKHKKLRSVQGLIEALMAGKRVVGDSLKLERRVSIDQMPVFGREVVMETEEYRIARELSDLIDADDLSGVKRLLDPIHEEQTIAKIEYMFDDRDPVTYAVDKKRSDIADFLISRHFTFTRPYRMEGSECDQWCYIQHTGEPCPNIYTAMTLASSHGLTDLHDRMQKLRAGLNRLT